MHKQIENNASKPPKQLTHPTDSSSIRYNNVSRSNSINSLDKEDMRSISGSISSSDSNHHNNNNNNNDHNCSTIVNNTLIANQHSDVYVVDIDKQKVIEKVVKLQKTLAKKSEKIDFLQDHVNQLTSDLQKKTRYEFIYKSFFFKSKYTFFKRIIQAYAMKQEVGAFTSEAHDENKVFLGIMFFVEMTVLIFKARNVT